MLRYDLSLLTKADSTGSRSDLSRLASHGQHVQSLQGIPVWPKSYLPSPLFLPLKSSERDKFCICFHICTCLFEPTLLWSRRVGGNNETSSLIHVERFHEAVLTGKIHLPPVFSRNAQYCISLHCFNWKDLNCPMIGSWLDKLRHVYRMGIFGSH